MLSWPEIEMLRGKLVLIVMLVVLSLYHIVRAHERLVPCMSAVATLGRDVTDQRWVSGGCTETVTNKRTALFVVNPTLIAVDLLKRLVSCAWPREATPS